MSNNGLIASGNHQITSKHFVDRTAQEILWSYAPIIKKEETKQSSITSHDKGNYKFELGGMLVYDIKALLQIAGKPQIITSENKPQRNAKPHIEKFNEDMPDSELEAFFKAKAYKPCPEFKPEYSLEIPNDQTTLIFDSKFESGNLDKVIKLSDFEYKLFIRSDTETSRHNHWYYFSVKNFRPITVTFRIENMLKRDPLYRAGMKPLVWSTILYETEEKEWYRGCYDISYEKNEDYAPEYLDHSYYCLSFKYNFQYTNDLVYFAYAYPYTYTDLLEYLSDIEQNNEILRINPLCQTLGGNICKMLTITENVQSYISFEDESHEWGLSSSGRRILKMRKQKLERQSSLSGKTIIDEHSHKKGIVLTARVHSGETVSSFMIKGAIDFLLGNTYQAKLLRKKFVFRIIPMLNVDGVRYGNSRCCLLGIDLNRRWEKPNKILHPTIFYAKKMIEVFNEKNEIIMCCDMHGHSKKKNVFMYGCNVKSYEAIPQRKNLLAKVIPLLLSRKNKCFSYFDSHFRMEKSKFSTERIVVYNEMGIAHSYTLEASFFGPRSSKAFDNFQGDMHMKKSHLEKIGADLCELCLTFASPTLYMRRVRRVNDTLRKILFARPAYKEKKIKKQNGNNINDTNNTVEDNESSAEEQSIDYEGSSDEGDVNKLIENDEKNHKGSQIWENDEDWEDIDIVNISDSGTESSGSDSSLSEAEIIKCSNFKSERKSRESIKSLKFRRNSIKSKFLTRDKSVAKNVTRDKSDEESKQSNTFDNAQNLPDPHISPKKSFRSSIRLDSKKNFVSIPFSTVLKHSSLVDTDKIEPEIQPLMPITAREVPISFRDNPSERIQGPLDILAKIKEVESAYMKKSVIYKSDSKEIYKYKKVERDDIYRPKSIRATKRPLLKLPGHENRNSINSTQRSRPSNQSKADERESISVLNPILSSLIQEKLSISEIHNTNYLSPRDLARNNANLTRFHVQNTFQKMRHRKK
ncbi:unnamed protein product [Blepharisma stoltei]|uniref:Peptidase M14 domain-containing protein n=1 Tax=Blepharisma stoltei TaxID=1481888 RepID=A0AAU9JFY2_9CILI|nr:unnamed protein product [Blepharisma stoltei]